MGVITLRTFWGNFLLNYSLVELGVRDLYRHSDPRYSPGAICVERLLSWYDQYGINGIEFDKAVRFLIKTWCCSLIATVQFQAIDCT